jgi:hypothetical protein
MKEHDTVVLTRPLEEYGLAAGDVGAIVHIYENGSGYEVEFVSGAGTTIAVLTLEPEALRPVAATEILHVRKVPA